MVQVDYKEFIEVDPGVRFGRPVIKRTRITVYGVFLKDYFNKLA